jgi:hypothetical protein
MADNFEEELRKAIDRVISSTSLKKLVVAGPGTGKTTLFRKLLESSGGDKSRKLVLTFLSNLKHELEDKLSDLGGVFTFHGYCHLLLRRHEDLRKGLTNDFTYFPGLASLIKADWELVHGGTAPKFIGFMRDLQEGAETEFYLNQSNYYDAVEFDDSVFRVRSMLATIPETVAACDLILVDEYQDFNRLEASFIDLLASRSPIVIVGDDDQALYSQLRGSSHEFIRQLHRSGDYERFELPFCLRCPEAIVGAVSDVIERATTIRKLGGRIRKPYLFYPPRKGTDSEKYPRIKVVSISTQQSNANYMGKYISQVIRQISLEEIRESRTDSFPTVLIIGPVHYLRQVADHLSEDGYQLETKEDAGSTALVRTDAYDLLHLTSQSGVQPWLASHLGDRPTCHSKEDNSPVGQRIFTINSTCPDGLSGCHSSRNQRMVRGSFFRRHC